MGLGAGETLGVENHLPRKPEDLHSIARTYQTKSDVVVHTALTTPLWQDEKQREESTYKFKGQ